MKALQELETKYQVETYAKYPIALERGCGSYVFDINGKRYLDFYGGHAVALTGHCHPAVVEAITVQAQKLLFYSNVVYSQVRAQMVQALINYAPPELEKVFLCNSGAEANETALTVSLRRSGRTKVIAFHNGFHGRTLGALSVTGIEKYRKHPYLAPQVVFSEFGDLAAVEDILSKDKEGFAAIILEPIQSMAGVCMASPEFYSGLRSLCDRTGTVLIFDEIQTGLGRTGKPFFGAHIGVVPDIITLAKGLASGLPIGAVLMRKEIAASIKQGELGSTFGGGPVVCAAALATIDVLKRDDLALNAAKTGSYLSAEISAIGGPNVSAVRGNGLLIGIECKHKAKPLLDVLRELGVLAGSAQDEKIVRLLPPLTISMDECDEFLCALTQGIKQIWQ